MIHDRIIQFTVPCSDDGKKFIQTDRIDLIGQALGNSDYECLADLPLAKVYNHRDFRTDKPAILVSCHIDSVYEEYFARLEDGELQGTFDNSACNALIVEAMIKTLLPAQALISFTGDEEKKSRGADRTIEYLQKIDVFQNLEMVISLDLTEEYFDSCHFTIENHSVEKRNRESLLKFCKKRDMVDYLSSMIDSPVFVKNADPDESWLYREYDLNCFSLCLPCRLLGEDMHDDSGVAIKGASLSGYIEALKRLTRSISEDLTSKHRMKK
jgi:hypothetical protein